MGRARAWPSAVLARVLVAEAEAVWLGLAWLVAAGAQRPTRRRTRHGGVIVGGGAEALVAAMEPLALA
ncbi:hypothetical protein [Sphingomonas aerophila]|uniref:Uncharacterized protein n=1 Tax=Sphingomonas aerophila TaxID=1344948 RepID=A0A7W9BAE3_9SPHN|nr:hypothetical protein [Sphingomonas aerophila]MBB5713398.1 hypothetical protein [Sphingomonas aerophila]